MTDYVVNELNKINGVMIEKDEDRYSIMVITPKTIYNYFINRGYAKRVKVDQYKFSDGSNKTNIYIRKISNQNELSYLVYGKMIDNVLPKN